MYTSREGSTTLSGNGLIKTWAVTHGLGYVPRKIMTEVAIDDGSVLPHYVKRDATLSTSGMTFVFPRAPPIGTNNVIAKWIVMA
jgi:hypothetical protein